MKRGFTIIELLVASLLLAMLVTMLTMIFNQSSVSWRSLMSTQDTLEDVRHKLGAYHDIEDDILPGLGDRNMTLGQSDSRRLNYRTVSLFRNWNGSGMPNPSSIGYRTFDQIQWGKVTAIQISDAMRGDIGTSGNLGTGKGSSSAPGATASGDFIVGVRSAGPDKKFETEEDNVNTFPEEID